MSFLTPRRLNSAALRLKFTNARFVPPLRTRNGWNAHLRFAAPRRTKVPQARLYTRAHHVPPPCPLSRHRGAAPGVPGAESIAPSSSPAGDPVDPYPDPPAGPCLRRGAAPRRSRRPAGLPQQTGTSEGVCPRSRRSGERNFVSFYWLVFFFSYTLNLNKVFFTE